MHSFRNGAQLPTECVLGCIQTDCKEMKVCLCLVIWKFTILKTPTTQSRQPQSLRIQKGLTPLTEGMQIEDVASYFFQQSTKLGGPVPKGKLLSSLCQPGRMTVPRVRPQGTSALKTLFLFVLSISCCVPWDVCWKYRSHLQPQGTPLLSKSPWPALVP